MTVPAAGEEAGIRAAVHLPVSADLQREIEAWIARQPAPRPTIGEALEQIVRRSLLERPGLGEFST